MWLVDAQWILQDEYSKLHIAFHRTRNMHDTPHNLGARLINGEIARTRYGHTRFSPWRGKGRMIRTLIVRIGIVWWHVEIKFVW